MSINEIEWENYSGEGASLEEIKLVEEKLGVVFPHEYIEIVLKCDGGDPSKPDFDILDPASILTGSGIGAFLTIKSSKYASVLGYNMTHLSEFFPEGLVSFATTGNGDLICFDYREGKHLTNPPIVYWSHESDIGEDVFFLANNFREFLEMLKEPED